MLLRYGSAIGSFPLLLLLERLPLDLLLWLLVLRLAASSDNTLRGLWRHAGLVGSPVSRCHGACPLARVRVLRGRFHHHLCWLLAAR